MKFNAIEEVANDILDIYMVTEAMKISYLNLR